MVFRVTQKLAKKIKVVPATALLPHNNLFLDWTAHLFMVSRWQCIILTNSRSLYSIIMAGKGCANEKSFVEQGLKSLRNHMVLDGTAYLFDAHIMLNMDIITFCKAGDRRVVGSMNDLIYQAKVCLLESGLSLPLVNMRLNETPMSMLGYRHPKETLISSDE